VAQCDAPDRRAPGTPAAAVSRPWTSYERRAVLAARTQLRWRTIAVLWPRDAESVSSADSDWLVDVVALCFAAAVTVARETRHEVAA
jgi:hypothetical protein